MKHIPMRVRAIATMLRFEMRTLEEYCVHGDMFFAQRLQEFKKDIENAPEPWPEDVLIDTRHELQTHLGFTSYFGLLMAFSALERYLDRLYDLTKHIAMKSALRDALLERQGWLKIEDYKKFLSTIGIDLTKTPYQWKEIVKMNAFRNAIAHQGGAVTRDNADKLRPYKYKVGDWIEVNIDDVRQGIKLVQDTVGLLSDDYVKALKRRRIIR